MFDFDDGANSPQKTLNPAMSRRSVLMAAAGAAALAVPYRAARAADDDLADPATGAIDAHVHVWTPNVKEYPLAKGFAASDMQPPSFTPEELFAHARPCGVARIVLIQMSFYGYDNSYMLDCIARHEGVFSGVAVIDPNAPKVEATMDDLRKRGVRGYRLYPNKRPAKEFFADSGVANMFAHGAKSNQAMCLLINPPDLPLAAALCDRRPETTVVVDHFARIGVDGEIRKSDLDNLCDLAKRRNCYVKISAYYALGRKEAPYDDLVPMIRRLIDAYGVERLMWATDCPYQVQEGHEYETSISLVRERLDFLSASDRDWLLRKTAEQVFFSA